MLCTNCHTIMKAVSAQYQLKTAFQPDTCFQCHKDKRAKMFSYGHMPMREGKIVCSDCHNPHGSPYLGSGAAMLWTNTINETCYKCHAEKRGPFLFEHEPVRENCLNCHDPHGSINEFIVENVAPAAVFRVPHDRPWRDSRTIVAIRHGPSVPELPHHDSWQQQSGRCGFPAMR